MVTVAFFWATVTYFVIISSLPFNPLSFNKDRRAVIGSLLPQGWRFFTKNPRDHNIYIYANDRNNQWQLHSNLPNAALANYFGLRRVSRKIGLEYGLLRDKLRDASLWSKTSGHNHRAIIFADTIPVRFVRNDSNVPLLCGTFYFVEAEPLPWAWSKDYDPTLMPSQIIKVYCLCSK